LFGVADVVELYHEQDVSARCSPSQYADIVPVEYKRCKPKKDDSDRVQLCAQAMCLEDMFQCDVTVGYLFYGKRKRRTQVELDHRLRERTCNAASRLHEMIANRETPRARREPKCDNCSLMELCLPGGTGPDVKLDATFRRQLESVLVDERGPKFDAEFDAF